jgi:hypothetical protein
MTATRTDWTRALSTADLYVITSNTTDPQNYREAMAEIERRDEEGDLITDPAEIEQIKARLQYTAGQYETPHDDA